MKLKKLMTRTEVATPTLALTVTMIFFFVVAIISGRLRVFDFFNGLQGFASLGLIALALGLTMIVGEFDLSVVGVASIGAIFAVQYGLENPFLGVLIGVAAGIFIGLLQGTIIAKFRISSIPVTLSVFIVLLGLSSLLTGGLSITYRNSDVTFWVDNPIGVFSPRSLIVLGLFVIVGVTLLVTRWGPELRAIGGERRASRSAGVRVDPLLIGVFATSGALAGLSGALLGYSGATANPTPNIGLLILGLVGALIGGVTLAGGKGSVFGVLAGTLAVAFLNQSVLGLKQPEYVSQIIFAIFLSVIVVLEAQGFRRFINRRRAKSQERKAREQAEAAL
jgi:ribose transport system permease protein